MGLVENYKWICIKTMTDSKKAYELEQVFYKNKMPFQVRQMNQNMLFGFQ